MKEVRGGVGWSPWGAFVRGDCGEIPNQCERHTGISDLGLKKVRFAPYGTNPGIFPDQFSVHFGSLGPD